MTQLSARPVRVAIVNDYEIVVAGVVASLRCHAHRVRIVGPYPGRSGTSTADVILFDPFGRVRADDEAVAELIDTEVAKIVIFTWDNQPDLRARSIASGAWGPLFKGLPVEDLVRAIETVSDAEHLTDCPITPTGSRSPAGWLGREAGLTRREAEVLALIVEGLTNQQIADRAYLSINSVKSYIRAGYRKIGVSRRSQAVSWGIEHGLLRPAALEDMEWLRASSL